MKYKYFPLGDNAVIIKFSNTISKEINEEIRKCVFQFDKNKINGVTEWTPTYNSITVFYNPLILLYKEICDKIDEILSEDLNIELPIAREIIIPVVYGGEYGPDLDFVCKHNNLSREEVIQIHSEPEYLVYMLGFSPGFPYLGGMDKRIATPRLETPRQLIKAGSVGIADIQTGIYSFNTPGGWQIIGRTPLQLFDFSRDIPALLQPGDKLKFKPVTDSD